MKYKIKIVSALILLLLALLALFSAPTAAMCQECFGASDAQTVADYKLSSRILDLFTRDKAEPTSAGRKVWLGGDVFGAKVKQSRAVVVASELSGIEPGDVLLQANGKELYSLDELLLLVRESGGAPITLSLLRGQKKLLRELTPSSEGGAYRLGITLRDRASGIGTITYIDTETLEFGGLGHGICAPETGTPIDICGGDVTGVILGGIQKGETGNPGELCGILTDRVTGSISQNTSVGLFGRLNSLPKSAAQVVEVGGRRELKAGEAKLVCTLKNGRRCEYSISIFDIDYTSHGSKSFKIKVTDPALLAQSGGIVRGMSGSPIIQNGKLVGAVTHVMVANPTEGYGIFIENMLNAAQMPMAKAS